VLKLPDEKVLAVVLSENKEVSFIYGLLSKRTFLESLNHNLALEVASFFAQGSETIAAAAAMMI